MKKNISMLVSIILAAFLLSPTIFAADLPELISQTAILIDADTGQVLYQKDADKRMYPASTTKIMTGLLVAENSSMTETAHVTQSAIDIEEWDSANIALIPNEELPIDSLMYGMMLPSANDAANVLAEHVAGSQSSFAEMMNERAASVGAVNTHFANAHGLHDDNHYTTAKDLALITREAVKNPTFIHYFGAATHTIPPTNLNIYERNFTNYQYMLLDSSSYYDADVIGGKVGYTHEARHTMSSFAERNGRRLICVVMNSPNRGDKFVDTRKLLDFGFNEFTQVSIPRVSFSGFSREILNGAETAGTASFWGERDFTALLHNNQNLDTLKISYSHTQPFSIDEDIVVSANFEVKSNNPAISGVLGSQVLTARVAMIVPEIHGTQIFGVDIDSLFDERPWLLPLSMFFGVVFISAILLFSNKIYMSAKQKRRLQMQLTLDEELERKAATPYRGPIPTVGNQFTSR